MEQYLFMKLGGLMLIWGAMTIIANNPVHSVFYLIFVFVNASAMLILLDVEFLVIIFLIVYVGAVLIFFLFVIMMFNIHLVELKNNTIWFIGIAVVFLWQSTALLENFSYINTVSTDPWFNDTLSFFLFLFIWTRASIPRIRFDNFMHLGWKLFLSLAPLSLISQ